MLVRWLPLAGRLAPFLALALLLASAGPVGADGGPAAPATPAELVYGVFPASVEAVVDGDTLRMPAGEPTVRVIALDCEEVFRDGREREAATADFEAYARARRAGSARPVKFGTPAGEAARDFVRGLFAGVTQVRLERDRVGSREIGGYGRRLAHVVLLKPSGEVNLAEAVIRQGHSPYFVKYGRSARFDDRFREAEAQARAAARGIWSRTGPAHYLDYPERLAWWTERAAQVERWSEKGTAADRITLGEPDAERRIRDRLGTEVVVFGLFDRELETRARDRSIFLLGHLPGRGLALAIFDPAVRAALDMPAIESMYVRVRGVLTLYNGKPQIVIDRPDQISTR